MGAKGFTSYKAKNLHFAATIGPANILTRKPYLVSDLFSLLLLLYNQLMSRPSTLQHFPGTISQLDGLWWICLGQCLPIGVIRCPCPILDISIMNGPVCLQEVKLNLVVK